MTEVWTLLWETQKLLRARKLFWVVMSVTLGVALMYASIGFNNEGFSFLFGLWKVKSPFLKAGSPEADYAYLSLFSSFIVPHWFGFASIGLALFATCSLFPELMMEGSVETVLSKPIARWKIFLTKYLGALLFMAVPLTIFCLVVFLAMGLRMQIWMPKIFIAVPLLTFVFSTLYSFATLVGVRTRSTLFALISTFLLWILCFVAQFCESGLYVAAYIMPELDVSPTYDDEGEVSLVNEQPIALDWKKIHSGYSKSLWVLPKPRQGTLYLKKILLFDENVESQTGGSLLGLLMGQAQHEEDRALNAQLYSRLTPAGVILPSIIFQIVCLSVAGWIFCRRDF